MKKRVTAILLIAAMMVACLTGCGSKTKLKVFLPSTYHDKEVFKAFEKEYNCRIVYETFESNESMYTKISAGDTYDVLIPSDYMIERLIAEDKLQPIDKSIIDLSPLADEVKNAAFDPDNTYSVPYFWGTVGIVYDTTVVDIEDLKKDGWNIFKNTKYKGNVYLYDSERDVFMMALKALGYSCNTKNEAEINAAADWLMNVVKTMKTEILTDEVIDNMAQGKKALAPVYSGDAAYIISENEKMSYFMPEEGTNRWIDSMVIMKDSQNTELANQFINYMLTHDAAEGNATEVGYASSNKVVLNEMTAPGGEYEGNVAYHPEKRDQDEIYNDNEVMRKIIPNLWLKIQSAAN